MIREIGLNFKDAEIVKASNGEDIAIIKEFVEHGHMKSLVSIAIPARFIGKKEFILKIEDIFELPVIL